MQNLKLRWFIEVNESTSWDSRIDDYRTYSYESAPRLQFLDKTNIWRDIPIVKEKI